MTYQETKDNNKLIAEFMGFETYQIKEKSDGYMVVFREGDAIMNTCVANMVFHSSWNWLMPVVEKIEENEAFDVDILQYGTRIYKWCEEDIVNNIADISFDKKIDHTYDAVVKFIKWYNLQNK